MGFSVLRIQNEKTQLIDSRFDLVYPRLGSIILGSQPHCSEHFRAGENDRSRSPSQFSDNRCEPAYVDSSNGQFSTKSDLFDGCGPARHDANASRHLPPRYRLLPDCGRNRSTMERGLYGSKRDPSFRSQSSGIIPEHRSKFYPNG